MRGIQPGAWRWKARVVQCVQCTNGGLAFRKRPVPVVRRCGYHLLTVQSFRVPENDDVQRVCPGTNEEYHRVGRR